MDATGQGLIIDVLGKELDGEGEVAEGQVLANVMHKVGKCAVGEGPECLPSGVPRADQDGFIKQLSMQGMNWFLSSVVRMCLAAMSSSFLRCAVSAGQLESSCSMPFTIC